jgi:hypothetical protein|tara:strand:+ start:8261 stop:8362 length:102 start_codon:yes stop_codon:yes gene_type:complete
MGKGRKIEVKTLPKQISSGKFPQNPTTKSGLLL